MPDWSTACPDWEDRILNPEKYGHSLVPNLPLFKEETERASRNFKRLQLPDVIGMPTMAHASGPWFFPIVDAIFGSLDVSHTPYPKRMINEFFLLVPKKNGKTSYSAAIMVTALIVNRRPNAEFLLVAPTIEIAKTAFGQASGIIRASPVLSKIFRIIYHEKRIVLIDESHPGARSFLQIKAADEETITGVKATGILVDETHVFARQSRAPGLFLEIRGSQASRPDGFMIQISTQSKERPSGIFKSELNIARDVRDGILKDRPLLPIIYELPVGLSQDGGWKDRKYWPLVNPNLGRSVSIEFLERELVTAEREGAGQMALFASQHHNVEIGIGLRIDGWAGAIYWQQNALSDFTLEKLIAESEVIEAGVDGGGLDDLLSLSFIGRKKDTREWLHWQRTWVHEIGLERRKSEAQKMRDFEKDGDLVIVSDMRVAFAEVADLIAGVEESGLLHQIGFDPIGVGLIVDALAAKGIEGDDRLVGIPQGYTLQGAIKTAEVKLASGELKHAGQPIMTWAAENAKVEPVGNAIRITKAVAGTAKIDPLMSLFDAVALMSKNPSSAVSVYETDDFVI